jgi:hypothetical protein
MVTKAITKETKDKWKEGIPSNPPVIIHERVSIDEDFSYVLTNAKSKKDRSSSS